MGSGTSIHNRTGYNFWGQFYVLNADKSARTKYGPTFQIKANSKLVHRVTERDAPPVKYSALGLLVVDAYNTPCALPQTIGETTLRKQTSIGSSGTMRGNVGSECNAIWYPRLPSLGDLTISASDLNMARDCVTASQFCNAPPGRLGGVRAPPPPYWLPMYGKSFP